MESYNFDTIIDRQGTNTVAIDGQKATFGRDGLMPLWVADMDFETPSFIVEALQQRLNHHYMATPLCPMLIGRLCSSGSSTAMAGR